MPSDERRARTKAEQRVATMARLVAEGRACFSEVGYAEAATEEIVSRVGVTRGALYHHFGSKEGLFAAVVAQVQAEIGARVAVAAAGEAEPWRQLVAGCRAFLAASLDPEVQRIVLLDAPAVLGWDAWRAQDAAHSGHLLEEALATLSEAGEIVPASPTALAHLLSGAMNETALWIARSPDPARALDDATATLERLLAGLRQSPVTGPH